MVITMLVSAGLLVLIVFGMLLVMSRRTREAPRKFEPRLVRPASRGSIRINGEDD